MPTEDERLKSTTIMRVAESIKRRAGRTPDRRIEVTGVEIAKETGLKPNQVHDAIFLLTRRGVLQKEQSGARYRPMILRVLDSKAIPVGQAINPDPSTVECPNCGHSFDYATAVDKKIVWLTEQRAKLEQSLRSTQERLTQAIRQK